ncbi:twin-arginine translocase TatA/TatE family subunit [Aestuariibacter sp. A3R04]|uniref:twin-arginine translocase TatA/TatE family subunit n=1 Tax=Aestuariibacter sp. A3R04 TaxID=2841571 RepID=UPI001C09599F|nr:twin-arginine translocase TatA/TatE family subunit [Aestuariibacter sp. A3R04]MBU3023440.1 twin-arginine translocase TatA/TatE family subunit [Aestuariibacter sp. A3R04]
MFDLSLPELFFVGVLALLIIGPKDLPELFQLFGKLLAKIRRMYADLQGSMSQLQKEVNIVSGKAQSGDESWRELLPPEISNLPDDFIPGSMSRDEHNTRNAQIRQAQTRARSIKDAQSNGTNQGEPNER